VTVVVDGSVLAAAVAHLGADGTWSEGAIAEACENGSMAAPQMVLAEASNALRRMELTEHLPSFEAALAHRDLLTLEIDLFPFDPLAGRAWELRHNVTIYDAWYVALAEALSCPLLTLDRRLARAPGPICEIITPPDLRAVREPAIATGWTPFSTG
jgi:predicted nucleic acid-binding protein